MKIPWILETIFKYRDSINRVEILYRYRQNNAAELDSTHEWILQPRTNLQRRHAIRFYKCKKCNTVTGMAFNYSKTKIIIMFEEFEDQKGCNFRIMEKALK